MTPIKDLGDALQALRFLFTSIYEHILTLPDIHRALEQEFLHSQLQPATMEAKTGFFENLLTIFQYGQQRGEVRTDIPLEKLARYVGVLYVSLLFNPVEQCPPANYTAEVDGLLIFLTPALNP